MRGDLHVRFGGRPLIPDEDISMTELSHFESVEDLVLLGD